MPQTRDDIRGFILNKLGYGVVDVELTDEQINFAIDEGLRVYNTYIGQSRFAVFNVGANNIIQMPDECDGVSEVVISDNMDNFLVYLGIPLNLENILNNPSVKMSDIVLSYQYLEQLQRIVSADLEWDYMASTKELHLFPQASGVSQAGVYYQIAIDYLDLTMLSNLEYSLIRDYALAESMETLGYIRSKYQTLPSATGDMSLNGDTLLTNADLRRENIKEKFKALRKPIPFIVG